MFKRFGAILWIFVNQAGLVATLSGCGIVAVVGGVSGFITAQTAWLAAYGPIAWWGATLTGILIGLVVAVGIAHFRYKLAETSAMTKWKKDVDKVNPLDHEFMKKRISIQDIVSPITGGIYRKRFVDCELLGPANIILARDINMSNSAFHNCDFVVMQDKCIVQTGFPLTSVEVYSSVLFNCTIFISKDYVKTFEGMNANFVTLKS